MNEHAATQFTAQGTAYTCHGEPSAQPLVVLIHGLGLSRRLFDPMLDAFAARYAVLTYDLYGHGESAPPPRTATLSLYAEQIVDLLDTVGAERAALVGFSIGGMINRRFALDRPERLSALAILDGHVKVVARARRGSGAPAFRIARLRCSAGRTRLRPARPLRRRAPHLGAQRA